MTPLDRLSNSVQELINEGRLDEAEATCHELKRRYPDQIDWMERTADVAKARGDLARAAAHYRMVASAATRMDGFDQDYIDAMLEEAANVEALG